jgi:chromate reductase
MRLLGISGSLRSASHNTALLRAAGKLLAPPARLELLAGVGGVPAYNEDDDTATPAPRVVALRRAIASADALLIATPEYNGSIPGALKNALDWASRPFPANVLRDKPVAVAGASTGMFGAVWAQAELRKVLRTAGARVLDRELAVARADSAGSDVGEQLASLIGELLSEACGVEQCGGGGLGVQRRVRGAQDGARGHRAVGEHQQLAGQLGRSADLADELLEVVLQPVLLAPRDFADGR